MNSVHTTNNNLAAWGVYNYLIHWEKQIFGAKSVKNSVYMFLVTLVAIHKKMSLTELIKESGVPYKDIYRYTESLTRHYNLLSYKDNYYELSYSFAESVVKDKSIKFQKHNMEVLGTFMRNMRHHVDIIRENLGTEDVRTDFKYMRALCSPVVSKPIRATDLNPLAKLGYMKYNPITKILKLNKFAYKKDWTGEVQQVL